MPSLRELIDIVGPEDPLGCAFVIAAVLRSAVQGERSTFEGECASVVEALKHFDLTAPTGIQAWLDDLGPLADLDLPAKWVLDVMADD